LALAALLSASGASGKSRNNLEIYKSHPHDRGMARLTEIRLKIIKKFHLANTKPQPEYMI
jgi:hypothetical protein